LSWDASRDALGNLDDVLTTLHPGEFKTFPGYPAKLARFEFSNRSTGVMHTRARSLK
jgi:hypothetical protein